MILLDTSVLVAAYRRNSLRGSSSKAAAALRHMIESGISLGIPAIVLQEVLSGVREKSQFQELHAHLSAFQIQPATIEDHVAAAKLAAECSAQRIPCTAQTALVVAQAAHGGRQLWTLDRDLAAVARAAKVRLVHTRETASGARHGT